VKRLTDVFAILIALAGFAVSYHTQVLLAADHDFHGWEAWLWPGIADAAALSMVLRLHLRQVRAGGYTVEAWIVFGIASGIMIGANTVADRADPLGAAMHAVVPVMAMLVMHVVIHGRTEGTGQPEPAGARAQPGPPRHPRPPAVRPRGHRGPRAPRRVDQLRALIQQGHELTETQVADRFHVARAAARELLRAAHAPPAEAA